jgi:hypothetical protein
MPREYHRAKSAVTHRHNKLRRVIAINPVVKLRAEANFEQHGQRVNEASDYEYPQNTIAILGASEESAAQKKGNEGQDCVFCSGNGVVDSHSGQDSVADHYVV